MCDQEQHEYQPTVKRRPTDLMNPEEIGYAKLWAELELPKLLNPKENNA
jgi:hypothetical protein